MDILPFDQRVAILTDSAKYDVSCSSGGSSRPGRAGSMGSTLPGGVCHTWTADGRCISLLKILLTNACIYDCAYCPNRRSRDIPRVSLTPDEIVRLTVNFYRRNYIEGLFLSTGVIRSADHTMELLIDTAARLRQRERFNGYIHLKVVPGADAALVEQAGRLADRLSINMELPSRRSLQLLAPDKSRESIVAPMRHISSLITETAAMRSRRADPPRFAPAGQSTQLIIGATPESDRDIITLSEGLYKRLSLRRVYYSAFVPVLTDNRLPALPFPPLLREHRLYQADWLLRFYGFSAHELLDEQSPDLDLRFDPKCSWALRHLDLFPLEVNRADYEELLRVPGIGVRSARRILRARRCGRLDAGDLKKLGVVMKRAKYFLTAGGIYLGEVRFCGQLLANRLASGARASGTGQLELFSPETALSAVTGEL